MKYNSCMLMVVKVIAGPRPNNIKHDGEIEFKNLYTF
jgi:hypothetical protein